jgi:hypothetical protein
MSDENTVSRGKKLNTAVTREEVTYRPVGMRIRSWGDKLPPNSWTRPQSLRTRCQGSFCQGWIINLESNSDQVSGPSNQRTIQNELGEVMTESLPICLQVSFC